MTGLFLITWAIFGSHPLPASTGWMIALIICAVLDWMAHGSKS